MGEDKQLEESTYKFTQIARRCSSRVNNPVTSEKRLSEDLISYNFPQRCVAFIQFIQHLAKLSKEKHFSLMNRC